MPERPKKMSDRETKIMPRGKKEEDEKVVLPDFDAPTEDTEIVRRGRRPIRAKDIQEPSAEAVLISTPVDRFFNKYPMAETKASWRMVEAWEQRPDVGITILKGQQLELEHQYRELVAMLPSKFHKVMPIFEDLPKAMSKAEMEDAEGGIFAALEVVARDKFGYVGKEKIIGRLSTLNVASHSLTEAIGALTKIAKRNEAIEAKRGKRNGKDHQPAA